MPPKHKLLASAKSAMAEARVRKEDCCNTRCIPVQPESASPRQFITAARSKTWYSAWPAFVYACLISAWDGHSLSCRIYLITALSPSCNGTPMHRVGVCTRPESISHYKGRIDTRKTIVGRSESAGSSHSMVQVANLISKPLVAPTYLGKLNKQIPHVADLYSLNNVV